MVRVMNPVGSARAHRAQERGRRCTLTRCNRLPGPRAVPV